MITTIIAIWGALLSSVLGFFKLREGWDDRFRIVATLTVGLTNKIFITNCFSKPVTLLNYDLYWAKSKNDDKSYHQLDTGSEEGCNITISPNNTYVMEFDEQYQFALRADRGNLYITFYFIGRKPVTCKIFPFPDE